MSNVSHDFVTVDMRGLKAALVDRSRADRVSISTVVRRAVARELEVPIRDVPSIPTLSGLRATKMSIRLTAEEAHRLRTSAMADGASMGAQLTRLAAGIPAPASGAHRADLLAALVESSAELSTLNRSIHHLSVLLRQGAGQAAREYRDTLDSLAGEVRNHLHLASATLAELHPRRPSAERSTR